MEIHSFYHVHVVYISMKQFRHAMIPVMSIALRQQQLYQQRYHLLDHHNVLELKKVHLYQIHFHAFHIISALMDLQCRDSAMMDFGKFSFLNFFNYLM